jgi:diguanylate cyclase (GGDEF)-like protein
VVVERPVIHDAAASVAQRLKESLLAPANVSGEKVQLGASVGIAVFPDDAETLDQLCSLADQRMYAAKRETQLQAQTT